MVQCVTVNLAIPPISNSSFLISNLRKLLRQYRIILSADTASEVRQMLSQKRR